MRSLPIYYSPKMAVDSESYSPSSLKPRFLADRLLKCKNVSIRDFEPATFQQLVLSHAPTYVDDVLNLRFENGFGNKSAAIRDALPWIVGAEIAAAEHAARDKTLTWALCSGFHHAHENRNGGFCTFEGLSITGRVLHTKQLADKILIVDGDAHYGDGTVACIHGDPSFEYISYATQVKGEAVIADLTERIERFKPEIVLFQDGLDSYKYDPLSNDGLTYQGLIERTSNIAKICRDSRLGLCINLAGGYLRCNSSDNEIEPVLAGHMNAIKVSAEAYGIEIPEITLVLDGVWETEASYAN